MPILVNFLLIKKTGSPTCILSNLLNMYYVANKIFNKVIILGELYCSAPIYQLIWKWVTPSKPTDKSFSEITALVQDQNQPPHPRLFSVSTSTPELKSLKNQLVSLWLNYRNYLILCISRDAGGHVTKLPGSYVAVKTKGYNVNC